MPDGNSNETARCVGNAQRQAGGGEETLCVQEQTTERSTCSGSGMRFAACD